MNPQLVVNVRCLQMPLTGVQRYTAEVLRHFPAAQPRLAPGGLLCSHLWEQGQLPWLLRGRPLWSPANTGPLAVRRQVLTVHDIAPIDHPEWFSPAFAGFYGWLWPRLLPRVAHILTDSWYTRQRILERFALPAERVSVVPLGVDQRFAAASPSLPAALQADLQGRPFLLAVGSLDPRKNLARLIAAWERVRPHLGTEWRLVIVGGANPKVFAASTGLTSGEQVVWAGRVADDELPGLYAAATVFAYPSLYEGFGLPPLEAMAAGVPVLAANATSVPEAVGDGGLLVDPLDVPAIADAIVALAEDESLRERLRQAGRAHAQTFTWQSCAQGIISRLAHYC